MATVVPYAILNVRIVVDEVVLVNVAEIVPVSETMMLMMTMTAVMTALPVTVTAVTVCGFRQQLVLIVQRHCSSAPHVPSVDWGRENGDKRGQRVRKEKRGDKRRKKVRDSCVPFGFLNSSSLTMQHAGVLYLHPPTVGV